MKERLFFNPYINLSKNKTLELQSGTWLEWSYFDSRMKWNRRTDHAGFDFNIEILGLYFILTVYDNRHFDYENDRWMVYDDKPITKETHPDQFNQDGTRRFLSPGISIREHA